MPATGDDGAVSRRTLLIGGACALAAAVAVPVTIGLWPRPAPVPALVARKAFTVAHRGGSGDWPEMSQYAYAQSAAAGVDALEMSVARTSDGVWIGSHDATLDRLSGTSGFRVADHTWAEIRGLRIAPPADHPHQPSRPYWRLDDLIATYRDSHALWVDPKAVDPSHYPELISLMSRHVSSLKDVFVAKSYATNTAWPKLARKYGMQTWGFYYGRDLDQDPQMFARTQAPWTMLGLDWNASAQWWQRFTADGRPVVAHVLYQRSQRDEAIKRGADGLMIAGITEILG